MLQYEAPRIQTNIGDPGQSVANAQRGFAQLGAIAQDIMTREDNRTKEEEIAARYAEQVEREVANRKADVEYREKVFNAGQEEKADAKRILALQGQAATLLAAGKTKELDRFLKENPEANSFDIAKLKVDMDDRAKTRSIQMQQLALEAKARVPKDTRSIEEKFADATITKSALKEARELKIDTSKPGWVKYIPSDRMAEITEKAYTAAKNLSGGKSVDFESIIGSVGNENDVREYIQAQRKDGVPDTEIYKKLVTAKRGTNLFDRRSWLGINSPDMVIPE